MVKVPDPPENLPPPYGLVLARDAYGFISNPVQRTIWTYLYLGVNAQQDHNLRCEEWARKHPEEIMREQPDVRGRGVLACSALSAEPRGRAQS